MKYKIKVKNIFYVDSKGEMGNYYAGYNARLSKEKADKILRKEGMQDFTVLHVRGEELDVYLKHEDIVKGVNAEEEEGDVNEERVY